MEIALAVSLTINFLFALFIVFVSYAAFSQYKKKRERTDDVLSFIKQVGKDN